MHALIAHADWNVIGLPHPITWSDDLCAVVRLMLESKLPMSVLWGDDQLLLYNDPYIPFLSDKHPGAFGRPAAEVWPEIWDEVQPLVDRARSGEAFLLDEQKFRLKLGDGFQNAWFTINFAPLRDRDNTVRGMVSTFVETTHRVLAERRQSFLLVLADALRIDKSFSELMNAAARIICSRFEVDQVMYYRSGDDALVPLHHYCSETVPGERPENQALFDAFTTRYGADLAAGRVVAIGDYAREGKDQALGAELARHGLNAVLAVRVPHNGAGLSVLLIGRELAAEWHREDIEVIDDAAQRLGHTIDRHNAALTMRQLNQTLEARIEDRTAELAKARSDALEVANRLQFVLDSAEIGDWDLNLVDDTAYRSLRHDQCFGYTEPVDQWGFEQFIQHVYPEDREVVERQFRAAVANMREWHLECRVVWADGSIHWIATHGTLYHSAARATRMVGIVSDITKRKLVEEELKRTDLRKNEFLAMLAHELRNPLAPIGSAASLLRTAQLDQAGMARTGEIISRQVRHMAALVDELLDVSRVTRGQITLRRASVDLRALAAQAVEQVRPLIDSKRHRLELAMPPGMPCVAGDADRLVQVISNLLGNAAKFTPEGGEIRLACTIEQDQVVLTVADNGIGIAPEFLDQIFELFSQGDQAQDRSNGGLGIGLALARSLVELHGGSIAAKSGGPGAGSTMTVRLPRLLTDTRAEMAPAPRSKPSSGCWWSMTTPTLPLPSACWCSATVTWCRSNTTPMRRWSTSCAKALRYACSTSACRSWMASSWCAPCAPCQLWRTPATSP
jgi:PAS domain S-box-containing protein